MSQSAVNREDNSKQLWLDKLWLHLFDGDSAGLMSPGQIRREHRDRNAVRDSEMTAILETEQDINNIHRGLKSLDEQGNLIDTPLIDSVATHQIIENTAIDNHTDLYTESPATLLKSVVKEISVRDLERSLNVRKIAILAETIILQSSLQLVNNQAVNADWLRRWRESAQDSFNPELQVLWAQVLVQEVACPGTFNQVLLSALHQLSKDDLESLRVAAKYVIGDFIFNDLGGYFSGEMHGCLFESLEDMGLLTGVDSDSYKLLSQDVSNQPVMLVCDHKALAVTLTQGPLRVPSFKLTRGGRQLLTLIETEADLAYLFSFAKWLKSEGCSVVLGDWQPSYGGNGTFTEKMSL